MAVVLLVHALVYLVWNLKPYRCTTDNEVGRRDVLEIITTAWAKLRGLHHPEPEEYTGVRTYGSLSDRNITWADRLPYEPSTLFPNR